MHRVRSRLSYSNVISTLALFLVLAGGTAFAAKQMLPKNSVGTKQIKNNAITSAKIKKGAVTGSKIAAGSIKGSDIEVGSLGTVPNATKAARATLAETATTATTAVTAGNAASLGGAPAAAYAKAQLEPFHVIGAAGQPAFENGCTNYGGFTPVGFYKDPFGIVHFEGDFASCTAGLAVFTLPGAFRPAEYVRAGIRIGDTTSGTVRIDPTGEVRVYGGTSGSLTDVEFRLG